MTAAKPPWPARPSQGTVQARRHHGTRAQDQQQPPATAVRFQPSRATAAASTKLRIARMGPCRSANARQPSGFTPNQTLTPITAATETANRRTAQAGRYQVTAARTASGTTQAANSPSLGSRPSQDLRPSPPAM